MPIFEEDVFQDLDDDSIWIQLENRSVDAELGPVENDDDDGGSPYPDIQRCLDIIDEEVEESFPHDDSVIDDDLSIIENPFALEMTQEFRNLMDDAF